MTASFCVSGIPGYQTCRGATRHSQSHAHVLLLHPRFDLLSFQYCRAKAAAHHVYTHTNLVAHQLFIPLLLSRLAYNSYERCQSLRKCGVSLIGCCRALGLRTAAQVEQVVAKCCERKRSSRTWRRGRQSPEARQRRHPHHPQPQIPPRPRPRPLTRSHPPRHQMHHQQP